MSEWNLFLKGVMMDGDIKNIENPDTKLIQEKQWRFILNLECTSHAFEGFPDSVSKDFQEWKEWTTQKEPQSVPLQGKWEEALTRFQKLLVLKAFRDEKLVFKIKEFVEKELGYEYAHPSNVSMEEVFKDSDNKTPIIFILS